MADKTKHKIRNLLQKLNDEDRNTLCCSMRQRYAACVFLSGLASCCHLPMPAEKVFPFLSSCYYYALERKFGKLFQKKIQKVFDKA